MKKILQLIFIIIVSAIWNTADGQYGYEMELAEFRQTSESEFMFDVFLRKSASSLPFGIENFQFQVDVNLAILNSGEFVNSFLTVDPSETDLVGQVGVITDNLFVTNGINILFASSSVGNSGATVTVLEDDTWKKVATFIVQLSDGGELHNWGDFNPELQFRLDPTLLYSVLNRCDYTGTYPNYVKDGTFATQVNDRTLIPVDGEPLATRQLAGYFYSNDGDWDMTANWNNVVPSTHPAYHQLPGANNNAIINGNCMIPDGLDVSLLPNGGDGGELSVLNGPPPPIYTLTLEGGFGPATTQQIIGGSYNGLTTGEFIEGSVVTINTSTTYPWTFLTWVSSAGGSFTDATQATTDYTMPGNNVTVTANWQPFKGSIAGNSTDELSINQSELAKEKGAGAKATLYASLLIAPGGTLTVDKLYNDNINGEEAIVVQSNISEILIGLAPGSLIHNNSGVKATVERYVTSMDWHYISPPISNAYSYVYNNIYLTEFDEQTGVFSYIVPTTVPLVPMKGYGAWAHDGLTGTTTVNYAGTLNTGNQNAGVLTNSGGSSPGYNFVGNPYPCAIDWDLGAGWTKSELDNALYIWNPVIGNYGSYVNGTSINNVSNIIPSGQGFFVIVSSPGVDGSLALNNDARLHNNKPFFKNSEEDNSLLRLQITTDLNTYSDQAIICFDENATVNFDKTFDAYAFLDGLDEAPGLYSVSAENKKLAINTLPVLKENSVYPLFLTVGIDGYYTIEAVDLVNFLGTTDVFLEDKVENVIIDLNEQSSYSFLASVSDDPDRFNVHFMLTPNNTIETSKTSNVQIYAVNETVFVKRIDSNVLNGDLRIYDVMGKLIASERVNGSTVFEKMIQNDGIFMVTFVDNSDNKKYQRKVYIK